MKKTIYTIIFSFTLYVSGLFAQTNITWTFKDKIEKGFLKSHTSLNTNFSGFNNKEESVKFFAKFKSYREIVSADLANVDAKGNADVKLTMKQAHNKQYYVSMAQKLGVSYIQVNGQKKTPAQLMEEIRTKKK